MTLPKMSSTIVKNVMFGKNYILARSDGFVKCYERGWISGDYLVSAPFDWNGFTHKIPNRGAGGTTTSQMYKYPVQHVLARAFLPIEDNEDRWIFI